VATATNPQTAKAQVGRLIFSDTALSASGKQSCATCHDPSNAFGPSDNRSVPLGGPSMDLSGFRATPSLMYGSFTPRFSIASDGTPSGGFFRDGRSLSLADQAQQPFLTPFEMANATPADVAAKLATRPYLSEFEAVFGADIMRDPTQVLAAIGAALAAYQTEEPSFHPFSSKFDYYLKGRATLSPIELKGLALFNDPTKGNCATCHVSRGANGNPPLFTDFTYDNVGLPRNWKITANQAGPQLSYVPQNGNALGGDYAYYDLGLCGPFNTENAFRGSLCGNFKVPTLRNVALRHQLFHNGVFDNLNDAVTWYVTRDTNPTRWYGKQDGTPDLLYNDLPRSHTRNVNVSEVPYVQSLAPTLDTQEISDVIAFLCTLTDGYDPQNPAALPTPPQCAAAQAAGR
jgi:cytochrome c peroxidase